MRRKRGGEGEGSGKTRWGEVHLFVKRMQIEAEYQPSRYIAMRHLGNEGMAALRCDCVIGLITSLKHHQLFIKPYVIR